MVALRVPLLSELLLCVCRAATTDKKAAKNWGNLVLAVDPELMGDKAEFAVSAVSGESWKSCHGFHHCVFYVDAGEGGGGGQSGTRRAFSRAVCSCIIAPPDCVRSHLKAEAHSPLTLRREIL